MSLNLLKRELENDLDAFEAKKAKASGKKKIAKTVKKKVSRNKFVFNNRDYTKEDDFTDDCLKYLGVLDRKISSVKTDKIIAHNQKTKRQETEDKLLFDNGIKEEESIFTDADFEMVSQLNFVNSNKAYVVDEYTGDRDYQDVITDGKKKRVLKEEKKKKKMDF